MSPAKMAEPGLWMRVDPRNHIVQATYGVLSTFLCKKHTIRHFVQKNVLYEELPVSLVTILGFGCYASTKITILRKISFFILGISAY